MYFKRLVLFCYGSIRFQVIVLQCSLVRFSTLRENKKEGSHSHTSMTKLRNDSDSCAFPLVRAVDSDQVWGSRVVGLHLVMSCK